LKGFTKKEELSLFIIHTVIIARVSSVAEGGEKNKSIRVSLGWSREIIILRSTSHN